MGNNQAGLLLCAGRGSRFGSQKLLAKLPSGERVVELAASRLLGAVGRVVAVVADAPPDEVLIGILDALGCQVALNPRATEGMGTSIAAGVAATQDANGWLIALGDMPFVEVNSICAVAGKLAETQGIVVPTCNEMRGHPVGFAKQFESELLALVGDAGARSILRSHPDMLALLPLNDAGILRDIDLPEDLIK